MPKGIFDRSGKWAEAQAKRKKQFCLRGHDTAVVGRASDGTCTKCHNIRVAEYQLKYPEKLLARKRKFRGVHREKLRTDAYLRYHADMGKGREANYKRRGILDKDGTPFTWADRQKLLEKQENRCAMCGNHESELKSGLHVDHCHKTMIVRGLLCNACNVHLGGYENCKDRAEKYLREAI